LPLTFSGKIIDKESIYTEQDAMQITVLLPYNTVRVNISYCEYQQLITTAQAMATWIT